jgi:hypothetical protein
MTIMTANHTIWERLEDLEQQILLALHSCGASPHKKEAPKAAEVLVHALVQCGRWTYDAESALRAMKEPMPPCLEELDRALVALVQHPRDNLRLVDGYGWLGNWGRADGSRQPCHPLFRECQISLEGLRLVLEVQGIVLGPIEDDILGTLPWNPLECWWERARTGPDGRGHGIYYYQDTPGLPLQLEPARATLRAFLATEQALRELTAVRALQPKAFLCPKKEAARLQAISLEELIGHLILVDIVLHPEGGAILTYRAECWEGWHVDLDIDVEGQCEHVFVYGHEEDESSK